MSLKWKGLKTIAICVLVAFATIALRVDLLAAPKAKPQPAVQKKVTSASQFQDLLKDTEKLFEGMEADLGKKKDVTPKLQQLRQHRSDLQAQADNIRGDLAKTRAELIAKKLPAEIIQRHDAFAQNFEANLKALFADLDEADQAKPGQIQGRVKAARDYLHKNIYLERHIPLDPNKLPHRSSDFKPRKPITDPKEFKRLFPQTSALPSTTHNQQAALSLGDQLSRFLGIGIAYAQGEVDPNLAETIEVQFTQEIRDLAASLNHDPVKIYEWVRNNIEFVPTYGSIQGAQMCLLTKQGNAFDISSLLIALLRVSNIKARYVYGTIEIPIDKVMNWVGGFSDATSAADFIASGGIPITAGISGGKITAVRMEHVWVEAFVDYIPSRGAVHKEGDTWIPMDGSFKQYANGRGVDLYSSLAFNGIQFMNGYISDLEDITPYQYYGRQMLAWLDANMPEASIEDILGAQDIFSINLIKQQTSPFLSATLPYKVVAQGGIYPQLSDNLRHAITLAIADDISGQGVAITKTLPEISGKRITLSYIPATPSDETLVAQYGGDMLKVPPYLLNVKPVIKVDGVDTVSGSAIGMGATQTLTMTFISPSFGTDVVQNKVTAGAYSAITIQLQKTPLEVVSAGMEKLTNNSKNLNTVTIDDLLGELLNNIGLSYFHRVCFENNLYAQTFQMVYLKHPSEAITSLDINVTYLFGVPYTASDDGLKIDVDRDIYNIASLTGDTSRNRQFMIISGISSSAWENKILEAFYDTPSVSAIKLLKYANEQGVPVYTITSSNIDQLLPALQVASIVKTEIQNAINAGKEVIISQSEVTYYEWSGVGFIILDPTTGVGAYMISGGLAGGGTAAKLPLSPRDKASFVESIIGKIKRHIVIILALIEIGTIYKWGKKDPSTGYIDCSGLIGYVYPQVGIQELGTPSSHKNAQMQYNYVVSINGITNNPQYGDLIFFWGTQGDKNKDGVVDRKDGVTHVGIYYGKYRIGPVVADAYIAAQIKRGVDIYFLTTDPDYGNFWQEHLEAYGMVLP